jgi:membrane fusion protein (multidrug efflux system)
LVEDGLKSGERVIVEGVHRIQPGAPVKPMPVDQPVGGAEPPPVSGQPSAPPSNRSGEPPPDAKAEKTS